MKLPPLVTLVLATTAVSTAQAQDRTRDAEAARVSAVVRAVFAAAERSDFKALDTLYAGDSLTVFESAGINRGWKDFRDHHLAPELKEMEGFRYRPIEVVSRVQGDLAWATVSYALQGKRGTRQLDNFGRGTYILERRGSGWQVRHSHTASRARRPSDPPMPPS
jgi:ketosteroid isomerase-like protein